MKTPSYKKENKQDLKQKLEILKSSIDPRYLIESLGFKVSKETGKEIRCPCLIHGGDNTTAFRFNKETLTWVCFTHQCHDVNGSSRDIIGLIMTVLKTDFLSAVDYLKQLRGDTGADDSSYVEYKFKKDKGKFINQNRPSTISDNRVSEENLRCHIKYRSNFFLLDGFSNDTLDTFEVAGGFKDSLGFERDAIPIRDVNGKLLAFSMRNINKLQTDQKYILTLDFDKDKVLYNLNRAKKYCQDKPLILVEGFKSVWRLHECGIKNVVAVMGSSITPGQVNLLFSYALNGVVVLFDNDKAGVKGACSCYDNLKGKMSVNPIFITEVDDNGKGMDPADLANEDIYNYLGGYI
jgi:5S rRNA maturation endonuclease (ribonuclease M5)